MDLLCNKCGKTVQGLVKVSESEDLYTFPKGWCFACVYEKGLADFNKSKSA